MRPPILLNGKDLSLHLARQIAAGAPVGIDPSCRPAVEAARHVVEKLASGSKAVYGVNTGFGFLAGKRIADKDLAKLQVNLLRSHAAGSGPLLSIPQTRLAMTLRLNVLLKGMTGVRYSLCEALLALITAGIYPCVPSLGSVGASGDLAPLAHLALPLIGEGDVFFECTQQPAALALQKAGLKPYVLAEKEGLSLVNGTQIMLAVGSLALADCLDLAQIATKTAALSFEGLGARLAPLDRRIHEGRQHAGQIEVARALRAELDGSYLAEPSFTPPHTQDAYSLRCCPQVHGASLDTLNYVQSVLEREMNAATDNPLVFVETEEIVSGGNFHGQPIAVAFDMAAIAIAELASISERRLELLLNPTKSLLPAFLATDSGLESGYMAAQYLAASLVNENKVLSHPASTDSIPGNVGVEDHVSMGMTGARKLVKIAENTRTVLAVELMVAAQACDMRQVERKLGYGSQRSYHLLRNFVPHLDTDRIIAEDIKGALNAVGEML